METLINLANQSEFTLLIYPFYEDVKQFAKVYFINAVFNEDSSKFPITKVSSFTVVIQYRYTSLVLENFGIFLNNSMRNVL